MTFKENKTKELIDLARQRDSKKFWAFFKEKRIKDNNISSTVWHGHFKSVFETSDSYIHCEILHSSVQEVDDILDLEVTFEEVNTAIDSQKVGKACGIDGIQVEILKNAPNALKRTIHRVLSTIFDNGKFPSCWQVGVVSPVFKKGNKNAVSNYRPVTLLCSLNKLFTKT